MNRTKPQFHLGFQVNMVVWAAIYFVIFEAINRRLTQVFGAMYQENSVVQSIKKYQAGMLWILGVVALFSIVWWVMAVANTQIRYVFDQNTFVIAWLVIVLLGIIVVALASKNNIIVDNYGTEYPLWYGYCFLGGFLVNMFGFPPNNVKLVILGTNCRRRIAATIAGLVLAAILLK